MNLQPKNPEEAMNLVYSILNQGDSRYNSYENELLLSDFILKEAVSLEEEDISNMQQPKEELHFSEVQADYKLVAKTLLKQQGFQDNKIFFERRFRNSRPDVLAEKQGKIILVECCSCRISKIIDYLEEADEVWVITRGMDPWEKNPYTKDKMQLFIFKKGRNWKEMINKLKKSQLEQIKKVKSPIDEMMGEKEKI